MKEPRNPTYSIITLKNNLDTVRWLLIQKYNIEGFTNDNVSVGGEDEEDDVETTQSSESTTDSDTTDESTTDYPYSTTEFSTEGTTDDGDLDVTYNYTSTDYTDISSTTEPEEASTEMQTDECDKEGGCSDGARSKTKNLLLMAMGLLLTRKLFHFYEYYSARADKLWMVWFYITPNVCETMCDTNKWLCNDFLRAFL